VVEGGKEVAFPEQDLPFRIQDRGPSGRVGLDQTRVLLVGSAGDDVVRLGGVETTVVRRVGAGDDGLRLEHLDGHLVARLGLDGADQVFFEG